ncbi:EAL domain-containing protein [Bacillales bacterium AN1005]|uniref:sensor domain-containing protein n=1 Tax=Niallia taxi TaxID=2499688 RepID=UPI0021A6690A|nr:GGDEF and EAL domain-containing protein [Niallia taxi]MCT2343339.1 EAL domain-containing protein [Niallia taxi]
MVYKNSQTKWIITLCLFVVLSMLVNIFYHYLNHTVFIILHTIFSLVTIFSLLVLLKNISIIILELRNSSMKLQTIFETMDMAIWYHDYKTGTLLITSGMERIYGRSIAEFYQNNDLWKESVHEDDYHVIEERLEALSIGAEVTSIYRIVKPDGEIRWIKDKGIPGFDGNGKRTEFTSVFFDITESKENEDRFSTLVEMSPDIIAVVSNYEMLYINYAGSKLIGAVSPAELVGNTVYDLLSKEDYEKIDSEFSINGAKNLRVEVQVKTLQQRIIDVELSCMPIMYAGRHAVLVVGRDITERKKSDNLIKQLAYHDTLTELPNRYSCMVHLHERLHSPAVDSLYVLFLDLDQFKRINDTRGHSTGDIILKKVANTLSLSLKDEDFVARLGGDEFVIILENANLLEVKQKANTILEAFNQPLIIKTEEFFVTPSIGISNYPADGKDQETLIKNADAAMYLAKENGKNNYQFYSHALEESGARKMMLEMELRKAIKKQELSLYYQPQFNILTEEIFGVEALLRWNHPKFGFVSPAEFIPIAEETNLIVPIGDWVIKQAAQQMRAWNKQGINDIKMSINISARQFHCSDFAEIIGEHVDKYGLNTKMLELEITESTLQNMDLSLEILHKLKAYGFNISIDDFGKGYSSLSYLKHLPIDTIKIDKTFVDDITDPVHKGSLVKAIIDMGHNMNFSVIAEGIEQKEQLEFLKHNHCVLGQGFYYSKPLPKEDIEKMLLEQVEKH